MPQEGCPQDIPPQGAHEADARTSPALAQGRTEHRTVRGVALATPARHRRTRNGEDQRAATSTDQGAKRVAHVARTQGTAAHAQDQGRGTAQPQGDGPARFATTNPDHDWEVMREHRPANRGHRGPPRKHKHHAIERSAPNEQKRHQRANHDQDRQAPRGNRDR